MDDGQKVAAEYLRELRKQRDHYLNEGLDDLRVLFRRRERKPPEEFHDSSFLYMRTYHSDEGVRPILIRIAHWLSPDIELSPLTSPGSYTTQLLAGETYLVRCWVRNRGDLAVPSAKVELFLTDPTLGFDTRFATNLTLGKVPSGWVACGANAAVDFTYTVPTTEAGHKCLFARTFSFSPLELPVDDHQLDPRIDRHVAQKNLNIVGQAEAFSFSLIHAPNARQRIEFRALEPDELRGLRHPVLDDVVPAREFPREGWSRLTNLRMIETGVDDVRLSEGRTGFGFASASREGLGLEKQRELNQEVFDAVSSVNGGKSRMADHRDLFAGFREMTAQQRRSRFSMTIPDIGLTEGQAVGLEITSIDDNLDQPAVVGGITLVIVGG